MKAELYGINDGWGIVGYGFECPNCESRSGFINYTESEHACEDCDVDIQVEPLTYSHHKALLTESVDKE